jgi:hypothetical protein
LHFFQDFENWLISKAYPFIFIIKIIIKIEAYSVRCLNLGFIKYFEIITNISEWLDQVLRIHIWIWTFHWYLLNCFRLNKKLNYLIYKELNATSFDKIKYTMVERFSLKYKWILYQFHFFFHQNCGIDFNSIFEYENY